MLDMSLMEKREARLDFEAQIREIRDTLKKCKNELPREVLRKEEAGRSCLHLEYKLGETNRRITALENQDDDTNYMLLKNDYVCWRKLYGEAITALEEDQRVIKKLQYLYVEWKGKFLNLDRFSNLNILELPEKLQEVDWCMCPENTPPQVFNFVKFCKKIVKELTNDLATI